MSTVTEQIDEAIANSNGNIRDALNIALAQKDVADAQLEIWSQKELHLWNALAKIRELIWSGNTPTGLLSAIDDIARDALAA